MRNKEDASSLQGPAAGKEAPVWRLKGSRLLREETEFVRGRR